MSKHTPGPWNATKFNPATGDIDDCYLYVEPGIAVIERKVKGRDQHDTANARLLAAAPDLLEALEGFIDLGIDEKSLGKWPELLDAIHKASAAIDRAKGEEVSAKEISTPAHDCWFCDGTKEYQGEPCLICVEPKP